MHPYETFKRNIQEYYLDYIASVVLPASQIMLRIVLKCNDETGTKNMKPETKSY